MMRGPGRPALPFPRYPWKGLGRKSFWPHTLTLRRREERCHLTFETSGKEKKMTVDAEMPRYVSHKKVWALKIESFSPAAAFEAGYTREGQ